MILLDTDTYSLHHAGHVRVIAGTARAAEIPRLTLVTQIEAIRGRQEALIKADGGEKLLRAQQLLFGTAQHLALFQIVPFDAAGAVEFDRLVRTKGLKKIGRCDLLIASIALAYKALLVTRNLKDFRLIPALKLENWAD